MGQMSSTQTVLIIIIIKITYFTIKIKLLTIQNTLLTNKHKQEENSGYRKCIGHIFIG